MACDSSLSPRRSSRPVRVQRPGRESEERARKLPPHRQHVRLGRCFRDAQRASLHPRAESLPHQAACSHRDACSDGQGRVDRRHGHGRPSSSPAGVRGRADLVCSQHLRLPLRLLCNEPGGGRAVGDRRGRQWILVLQLLQSVGLAACWPCGDHVHEIAPEVPHGEGGDVDPARALRVSDVGHVRHRAELGVARCEACLPPP
mmetsp:Transcript_17820/g.58611  ORF Transcript_17820/g.58611 Transcript_17820/m.58611 type:complete len:202 (+) Transcript_17820:292-897(+)